MRTTVLVSAVLTWAVFLSTPAHADPRVTASEVYVVDLTSGTVPYAKHEDRRVPVASLTKVMTAYVVRKQADLDDLVTITTTDVNHARNSGATHAGLRAGERLTVRQLLYALLLPSAADASNALARAYGPGKARFVARMNAAARSLDLDDTRFVNADGLPASGQYSTARDQLELTRVVLKDRVLSQIARTRVAKAAGHTWTNTNKLLATTPGAIGLKTGYTKAAGYCLAFAARRDGHTYLGVILGDTGDLRRFTTARNLLSWAERVSDRR
ncbi:D-alanyl-D-alanine carboxypeptidase family protein [Herbidospora mongoliensis]|uniref:D-alanyl-D-alanine carboxypeptidase family protein n=1 Tax=Herbidospora mongoliensis TaxID=688067 RepID=UPI00082FA8F2|nr:D-alanyl-D-alanine carboxypeptidase family protein [Herbidospora mongoliensis]